MAIELFTWGYYGWGNHAAELIKAVDAVETARGYLPPMFVDIRIRRSVRAEGFVGRAFETLIGSERHVWMKSLGNKFIETRTGPKIQIADPVAAEQLLDLAMESARLRQRVIFFCSCQWPRIDGKIACHRSTVATLVSQAARRRGIKIAIQEWPGGNTQRIALDASATQFAAMQRALLSFPLGKRIDLAAFAGLPWGSIATIHHKDDKLHRLVGPAIRQPTGWALPVLTPIYYDPVTSLGTYREESKKLRKMYGYEAVQSDS